MSKERKQTPEKDGFANFNELNLTLKDLDERALVLTLAAFAEDTLGDLISAFLIPSAASRSLVTGFNAPLGNFSSRIKASYALGLITKGQFDDLQHLREIRNKFSHTWKPISFDDLSVAGHIKGIRFSRLMSTYPKTPKDKLHSAFQYLLIELQVAVTNLLKDGRPKPIGISLIGGFSGKDLDAELTEAEREVSSALERHGVAKGEEKVFFDGLLWTLKIKLSKLHDRHQSNHDIKKLIEELTERLGDTPDPIQLSS